MNRFFMRLIDLGLAITGLVVLSPLLVIALLLVWMQDGKSPFYVADRAGLNGRPFQMVKIRSMIIGADRNGVASTSATDSRVTPVGQFVRRWKIDELPQLWNVLKGDMSLVGPRPNTMNEASTYTEVERNLLLVRPGITDFSSIVFSDEGEILRGSTDPDEDYRRIIWPWKSRLGLVYVQHASVALNLFLVWTTIVAILDKHRALHLVSRRLEQLGADADLVRASRRQSDVLAPGQFEATTT